MKKLLDGFMRFRNEVFPRDRGLFSKLALGQRPEALFITCADSRVAPDVITQSGPGDLFMCRTVGNQVPPYGSSDDNGVASSIEYALNALHVKNIVVCGHSDCGAMKAVLYPEKVAELPSTAAWLRHADAARHVVRENYHYASQETLLRLLAEENILAQIQHLQTHPSVAARLARGELQIYGWFYEIHSGEITTFDARSGTFQPLGFRPVSATPPPRLLPIAARGSAA